MLFSFADAIITRKHLLNHRFCSSIKSCASSVLTFLFNRRASVCCRVLSVSDCGEQEWLSESPFSSCAITRSGCFKHSFTLRWDHVCWFSPFRPQNPHFIIIPQKEWTWGNFILFFHDELQVCLSLITAACSKTAKDWRRARPLDFLQLDGSTKDSKICFWIIHTT